MKEKLKQFRRDEEGLTTVEYAVAAALIAATIVAAFSLLGDEVVSVLSSMKDAID